MSENMLKLLKGFKAKATMWPCNPLDTLNIMRVNIDALQQNCVSFEKHVIWVGGPIAGWYQPIQIFHSNHQPIKPIIK